MAHDELEPDPDPLAWFDRWLREARDSGLREPHAAALATASTDGRPASRMVLLKGADERGFVFATHHDSRKGREIAANPRASLLFYWGPLERQIRIEGPVARINDGESDAIFADRPRGAQLAAWVSRQDTVIAGRGELERGMQELERVHPGTVPRPPHWGGYRLTPQRFEFWQGRPHRLHDRFQYERDECFRWRIERLAP